MKTKTKTVTVFRKKPTNKRAITIGTALLVAGGGIAFLLQSGTLPIAPGLTFFQPQASLVDTSSETYKRYSAFIGDEYDHQFLVDMQANHQGAVNMAKLARERFAHPELSSMAESIISTQEKDAAAMKLWHETWGYSESKNGTDSDCVKEAPGTSPVEVAVDDGPNERFDRDFLARMVTHHQSAIDIAGSAATNSQRSEIKELAQRIITKQSAEIIQFKQWQEDWGY